MSTWKGRLTPALKTNATPLAYTPRPDASPESEVSALAVIYRFVLFDSQASKGGPHDLTHDVAADWQKQKVQIKIRKEQKMTLWVAETYEPLPPGLYPGQLVDIESRESTNGQY